MTEKEKAAAGYLYNPNYDEELLRKSESVMICVMNLIKLSHQTVGRRQRS